MPTAVLMSSRPKRDPVRVKRGELDEEVGDPFLAPAGAIAVALDGDRAPTGGNRTSNRSSMRRRLSSSGPATASIVLLSRLIVFIGWPSGRS